MDGGPLYGSNSNGSGLVYVVVLVQMVVVYFLVRLVVMRVVWFM